MTIYRCEISMMFLTKLNAAMTFSKEKTIWQAVSRRFSADYLLTFYFLQKESVKLRTIQVNICLDNNKIRNETCQKQLHQSLCFWFLDFLLAQIHHLQLAQSQSRSQLSPSQFHKNCLHKNINPSFIGISNTPPFKLCGGCSC